MKFRSVLPIALCLLLAAPVSSAYAASSAKPDPLGPATMKVLKALAPKQKKTAKKSPVKKSSSSAAVGALLDFHPSIIGNGRTSVLFFKASWCSTCKVSEGDLQNLYKQNPPPLTVYRVDYDTNLIYRKKYRVSYQHTFVKIDGQGNFVTAVLRPDREQLKKFLSK